MSPPGHQIYSNEKLQHANRSCTNHPRRNISHWLPGSPRKPGCISSRNLACLFCGRTGGERDTSLHIMGITLRSILATTRQFTLGQHSLVLSPWPSCSKYGSPFVRGHLQGWFPNDFDLVVLSTCLGEVQELHKRTLSLILVLWGSSAPASMSRYHLHLWHVHAPGLKT